MKLDPERALRCLADVKTKLSLGNISPAQAIDTLSTCGLELMPNNVTRFLINGVVVEHPHCVPQDEELTWDLDDIEARLVFLSNGR